MNSSLNGFYVAYFTGETGQGLAMLVFRNARIVGVDVAGIKYDGHYSGGYEEGFTVELSLLIPPNTILVQGVTTGSESQESELAFLLPGDFLVQPFIRITAPHGPVNAKITKLRELDD